jgi:aminoacylase
MSSSSTADAPTTTAGSAAPPIPVLSKDDADAAIARFTHFLSYETVSRTAPETGAYRECAEWLVAQLKLVPALQSEDVFLLPEAPDHSPVVVARWRGLDELLPVILLNSHYDVVPVTDAWTKRAWGHWDRDAGRIYGRGTQDMKSVCMQYLEAVRHLSAAGFAPTRSVYLTFVPDEGTVGVYWACACAFVLCGPR